MAFIRLYTQDLPQARCDETYNAHLNTYLTIMEQALLDLARIALIAKGVSTEASKVMEALTMTNPNVTTDHGFTQYHMNNFN